MSINRKLIIFVLVVIFLGIGINFSFWPAKSAKKNVSISENEAVFEVPEAILSNYEKRLYGKFPDIKNWQRPESPLRVALTEK